MFPLRWGPQVSSRRYAATILFSMKAIPIRIVAAILGALCVSTLVAAQQSPSLPSRVLERHRLDFDGDGKPDEMIVWFADSLDPGIIGKIEFRLSHAGTRILQDTLSR